MSNPVDPNHGGQAFPPPNAGGAYPPPNAGTPGAPGAYPPPAPGAYPPPAPGAYPPPGAAGFPPPSPVEPTVPKKGGAGKKALSILGVIVVALVIFGAKYALRSALSSDPTADAKVGDCISVSEKLSDKETETEADVVDCSDSKAKFQVVGRVAGVDDVNSTACDTFFTEADKDPAILSSPSGADDKYLLCVKAKA
ncbi:LppU/SCO3897 family protein [Actinoplanes sp. HUAS TT8]|uniref:LppU/SCO3897 family protein n=1 Tax=Actinoplanes sp. HUAS TT8 TaxID=3447453 RepID=UPI003F52313D